MINDKMEIALAIKNSTYGKELECSLIENAVVKGCGICNLQGICEGIRAVAEDYMESTTRVINAFDFEE